MHMCLYVWMYACLHVVGAIARGSNRAVSHRCTQRPLVNAQQDVHRLCPWVALQRMSMHGGRFWPTRRPVNRNIVEDGRSLISPRSGSDALGRALMGGADPIRRIGWGPP